LSDDSFDVKKKAEIVERVTIKTKTMVQLIDDLLKISRIKTGKIKPEFAFLDAKFLAAQALFDCNIMAYAKKITVKNDIPQGSRIYGDRLLLTEVLKNLVTNAIKFSYRGSTVTVYIPEGKPSAIAVADTGIGIKPGHIDKLFSYEVQSSTKGTEGEEGTGMGLPLCMDIMKSHGGTLEVESAVGKGSVFEARLPHVRPKILLVDDKDARRQALNGYLREIDVDIMETINATFAMGIIERAHPHLVISDFESPDVDGPGFLASIKKNPNNGANTPFLAIIASPNMEVHAMAFRLGASDCISNSLEPEEIISSVRRFVGLRWTGRGAKGRRGEGRRERH
jgi:CheY-like chemotaxis protein